MKLPVVSEAVTFPHVTTHGCNRRCRDETAAELSYCVLGYQVSHRTTAHCRSLRSLCTHAYICGHMHTQRPTQGPRTQARVHKHTHTEHE